MSGYAKKRSPSLRRARAIAHADLLEVTQEQSLEVVSEACDIVEAKGGSSAYALILAARKVAARHKTMPGPLIVAVNALYNREGPGDCFVVACKLALDFPSGGIELVHGFVTGTNGALDGIEYWHAWCERNGAVVDWSNGNRVVARRQEYYAAGKVRAVARYSREGARSKILEHSHWGPWP